MKLVFNEFFKKAKSVASVGWIVEDKEAIRMKYFEMERRFKSNK